MTITSTYTHGPEREARDRKRREAFVAIQTPCQTPGAVFHIRIDSRLVSCAVELPFEISLTEEEAVLFDAAIHNAVELALAPLFVGRGH